jgi:hypothetical protein
VWDGRDISSCYVEKNMKKGGNGDNKEKIKNKAYFSN